MSVLPPVLAMAGVGVPEGILSILPYVPPLKSLFGSVFLFNSPHMVKLYLTAQAAGGLDKVNNNNPRAQFEQLKENKEYGDVITRAQAAHLNGLESFPVFAAGVLACVAVGADKVKAGKLACAHLLSRLGFNIFYIACGKSVPGGVARSLCWVVSLLTSCQLIGLAAEKA
eukprot:TRINITY_DN96068_c0_g1_i1.p1 TRINITY_DN96068_c0_g1~~TRINITY_DN96068_c0_g1_i1.p1  ORF type:complete len:170 (+),score=29.90 TRINITY_DN96068_c0_g1_i1:84-593(+)